jgi:hypothetical protein
MKKIAVITCYFGTLPWYFEYFLHSCGFNPTIDFFIFTNSNQKFINKPENVFFKRSSLKEIEDLLSNKLGFRANIPYPYKLCDVKPAYGFLFSRLLRKYDFWGHGDIDVVYGNIRRFMTKEILNEFDVISSRHDYITGTFALFKNNSKINTLFMQSKDYKRVFTNEKHFCFDECNFLWKQLEAGESIYDLAYDAASMTHVVKKLSDQNKLKAFFDFIILEGTPGKIKWENGKIIYKNTYEAMFYHLIKFKTACKKPIVLNPIPDTFYFTPTRILTKKKVEIPAIQTT